MSKSCYLTKPGFVMLPSVPTGTARGVSLGLKGRGSTPAHVNLASAFLSAVWADLLKMMQLTVYTIKWRAVVLKMGI